MKSSNTQTVYIDLDSCYYNVARKLYPLRPWTVIVNSCNHMISVPYWLDGHFGARKMTYFVPPVRAKVKVKKLIETFNVDEKLPWGSTPRDAIKEVVEREFSKIRGFIPSAVLSRKDSIVAECVGGLLLKEGLITLPHTVGVGVSEKEARADCARKKARKKSKLRNWALLALYLPPMVVDYVFSKERRTKR